MALSVCPLERVEVQRGCQTPLVSKQGSFHCGVRRVPCLDGVCKCASRMTAKRQVGVILLFAAYIHISSGRATIGISCDVSTNSRETAFGGGDRNLNEIE